MIHTWIFKKSEKTLILLHGTGGNEHDLIPLGDTIDSHANLLSIRGNISENGMNRFFKRIAPGIFDIESLNEETHKLHDFIEEMVKKYQLNPNQLTVVGYSNGANIAASLLFHYPDFIKQAILLHPMVPLEMEIYPHQQTRALITSGSKDPIVPNEQSMKLEKMLNERNVDTKHVQFDSGHQITHEEIRSVKAWYNG